MRALLIINPAATSSRTFGRDELIRRLRGELDLTVEHTRRRGHAEQLSRQAVADGLELVIAVGGDGTVHEVVNGLLADEGPPAGPALGLIPGGNANVFARALGVPDDPGRATARLLEAVRSGARRPVGLGRADERWFIFSAGVGLDAEVVREVERRRAGGTPASTALFVRSGIRQFVASRSRRRPSLTLVRPGAPATGPLALGLVSNTRPWTYIGHRALVASPFASVDRGLDLLAARRLGVPNTALALGRMLLPGGRPATGASMLGLHDLREFSLLADEPVAVQLDGEYVGDRHRLEFRAEPGAIAVASGGPPRPA